MFKNRIQAGELLSNMLKLYKNQNNCIVVGLPRGGVPVAFEISRRLNLPLDIICPRKIAAPMNKEFAIGAITETGIGIFDYDTINQLGITQNYIDNEVAIEKNVAQKRLEIYRKGLPLRNFKEKCIIIVDDGLATGATMKAAIQSIKSEKVQAIIVAIPVSPPETLEEIKRMVDEVFCLETPIYFQAVGQFYEDFSPTTDEEVIYLMKITE